MQLKNMKVRYMDVASYHLKFSRSVFRQINKKIPFLQEVQTTVQIGRQTAQMCIQSGHKSVWMRETAKQNPPERLCLLSETGRKWNARRTITSIFIARLKLALLRHERELLRQKLLGRHCPCVLLFSIQPPHTLLSLPVSSTCLSHFFLVHSLLISFRSGKKKPTNLCNHSTSLHFCSGARSAENRLEKTKNKENLGVSHPITTESDEQGGKGKDKETQRDSDGREDHQCLHVKRGCA